MLEFTAFHIFEATTFESGGNQPAMWRLEEPVYGTRVAMASKLAWPALPPM
jgi:hypothetical protein